MTPAKRLSAKWSWILLPALILAVTAAILSRRWAFPAAPPPRPSVAAGAQTAPASRPTTQWARPRTTERQADRDKMVDFLTRTYRRPRVTAPDVIQAMRHVPRHLFVPPSRRSDAYGDHPLPIGYGQTISQPFMVAYMTQVLDLKPGDRVLEIGTGSGYQAAVLYELTPHVYSIEIVKPLAQAARKRLANIGYKYVKVKYGDGYFGWRKYAPFDAVIVTCAAGHVPPPLFEQLKPGGRMCVPVKVGMGFGEQLRLIKKGPDGRPIAKGLFGCQFVPMTGQIQRPR